MKLGLDFSVGFLCDRFDHVVVYDAAPREKLRRKEEALWNRGFYNENLEIRQYREKFDILEDFTYNSLSFDMCMSQPSRDVGAFGEAIFSTDSLFYLVSNYTPDLSLPSRDSWSYRFIGDHLLCYRDITERFFNV